MLKKRSKNLSKTIPKPQITKSTSNRSISSPFCSKTTSNIIDDELSNFHIDSHDERSTIYSFQRDQVTSQKAMSLPSSPHDYRGQASMRSERSRYGVNDELESTWNKVIGSQTFNNKPLLPYEAWNIELIINCWNPFRDRKRALSTRSAQEKTLTEPYKNSPRARVEINKPLPQAPGEQNRTEKRKIQEGYTRKTETKQQHYFLLIHNIGIVHCDLKSANCLVNKHWTVKICDLGLSRIMLDPPIRDSSSAGTPEWMAPELIQNEPFDEKCDIFSFGVMMWELWTLNRPWEGVPAERVVYSVAHVGSRLRFPKARLAV
ncbi:mitogen-activated protein kinase kinase kinase [Trifolium repens]|nr:mitogen-activated protein kinase kinase kinase [Trifolium repens]